MKKIKSLLLWLGLCSIAVNAKPTLRPRFVLPIHLYQQALSDSRLLTIDVSLDFEFDNENYTKALWNENGSMCVDMVKPNKVVETLCQPLLARACQFHVAFENDVTSGEYLLLARPLLPLTYQVKYTLNRFILHDQCHARTHFNSPINGQVINSNFIQVQPKISLTKGAPAIDFDPAAKVCLYIDDILFTCSTSPTIDVPLNEQDSWRLKLTVELNGKAVDGVCSDTIQIYKNAGDDWPLLLHNAELVHVAPSSHFHVLTKDIAQAWVHHAPIDTKAIPINSKSSSNPIILIDPHLNEQWSWSKYVSQEYANLFDLVQTHFGWSYVSVAQASILLKQKSFTNATLLFFEAPDLQCSEYIALQAAAPHNRRFLLCDDLHTCRFQHSPSKTHIEEFVATLDGFIGSYAYATPYLWSLPLPPNVHWLPHAASSVFTQFTSIHPNPVQRILLVGSKEALYYPWRAWAEANAYTLPIDVHGHPGYNQFASEEAARRQIEAYAKLTHSYLATFTDTSRLQYLVAKVFEIPAVGSLLLVNDNAKPLLEALGFIDRVHYMSYDIENPVPTIEYVLEPRNRFHVDAMRGAGQKLVREHHTVHHRAMELHAVLVEMQENWPWRNRDTLEGCEFGVPIGERYSDCVQQWQEIMQAAALRRDEESCKAMLD